MVTSTRRSPRKKAASAARKLYQESADPAITLGSRVRKYFEDYGWFEGTVASFDSGTEFYKIRYDDGDEEDLEEYEINKILKVTENRSGFPDNEVEKAQGQGEDAAQASDDEDYVIGSEPEDSDEESSVRSMEIDPVTKTPPRKKPNLRATITPSPEPEKKTNEAFSRAETTRKTRSSVALPGTPQANKNESVKKKVVSTPKKKTTQKRTKNQPTPTSKPMDVLARAEDGRDISKWGLPKGALATCPSTGFTVRALETVPSLPKEDSNDSHTFTDLPGSFTVIKVDDRGICPDDFVGLAFSSSRELHDRIVQHNVESKGSCPKIKFCTYNLRAVADPIFSSWEFVHERIVASDCRVEDESDAEAKDSVIQIQLRWDGKSKVSAEEIVFWKASGNTEPASPGVRWAFLQGEKNPSVLLGVPAELLEFREDNLELPEIINSKALELSEKADGVDDNDEDVLNQQRFQGADEDLLPQPKNPKAVRGRHMRMAASLLQKTIRRGRKLSSTNPLLKACTELLNSSTTCPGSTFEFLKSLWGCMLVDVSPFKGSRDCLGLDEILLLSLVAKADPSWQMPSTLRRCAVAAALRTAHLDAAQQWIGFVKKSDNWWILENPSETPSNTDALALRNVLRAVASVAGGHIKWGKWNKFIGDTSAASILAYLNHHAWNGSNLTWTPEPIPNEEVLLDRWENGLVDEPNDPRQTSLDLECQLAAIEPAVIPQSLVMLQALLAKPPTKWKKHSLPCLSRQWRKLVTEANPRFRAKIQLARLETWGAEKAVSVAPLQQTLDSNSNRQEDAMIPSFRNIATPTGSLSAGEKELVDAVDCIQSWQLERQKRVGDGLSDKENISMEDHPMTKTCRLTSGPPLSEQDGRWAFILAFAAAMEVEAHGEVVSAMFCGTAENPLLVQRIGKAREEGKEMATAGESTSGASAVPSLGYVQPTRSKEEELLMEEAQKAVAKAWRGGKTSPLPTPPPGFQWDFEDAGVGWDESPVKVARTADLLKDSKGDCYWKFTIGGVEVKPFDARNVISPCALSGEKSENPGLQLEASLEKRLRLVLYATHEVASGGEEVLAALSELHSAAKLVRLESPDEGAVYHWLPLARESVLPSRTWRDALLAIRTRDGEHVVLGRGVRPDGTGAPRDMTEGVLVRIFHALEFLYPMGIRKEDALSFRVRPRGASFYHMVDMLETLGRGLSEPSTSSELSDKMGNSELAEEVNLKPSGKRTKPSHSCRPNAKRPKRKAAVTASDKISSQADAVRSGIQASDDNDYKEGERSEAPSSLPLPRVLTKLWKHQESSVAEVVTGVKHGKRGHADASAVGSGKTLVALATIVKLAEWLQESGEKRHGVLVMLPSKPLIREWLLEIAAHTKGFHVIEQREDGSLFSLTYNKSCPPIDGNSLVISTLDRVARHPFLRQSAWDFVVVDECLSVQNADAKRTPSAWRQIEISSAGVLLLSATFFRSKYESLFYMIRMLRSPLPRSKEWLPATIHEHIVCKIPSSDRSWTMEEELVPLKPSDLTKYRGMIDAFRRKQLGADIINRADGRKLWVELEGFLRQKYEGRNNSGGYSSSSLYGQAVVSLVKKILRKQRRPLVFADTQKEANFLCKIMQSNSLDARSWDDVREALAEVTASKDNKLVIVADKNTAGHGLNMQRHADTIICRPTPGDHLEQMKGRVDRFWQKEKNLRLIVLVCEHTLEEAKFANIRLAGNFFREYIAPVAKQYREKIDLEATLAAGGKNKLKKGTVSGKWKKSLESAGQSGCFASVDETQNDDAKTQKVKKESSDPKDIADDSKEGQAEKEEPKYRPLNKVIRNKGDRNAVREAKEQAKQGGVSTAVKNWLFPAKEKTVGKKGLSQYSSKRFSDDKPPVVLDQETIRDALKHLSENDPKLGALIARVGPDALMADVGHVKPPTQGRLFDRCIRAITFTMVSVDAGNSFLRRLAIKLGVCLETLEEDQRQDLLQDYFDELKASDECTARTPAELHDRLLGGLHKHIIFTPKLVAELVNTCDVYKGKREGYPHLCGHTETCGKNDDPGVFLELAREHAAGGEDAQPVSAGYSRAKAGFIISILNDFESGKISGEKIARASDRKALEMLTELKGIGDWCAGEILMHFLSRADILLYGDLTVRNILNELYNINHQDASETLVESAADFDDNAVNRNLIDLVAKKNKWQPYRSVVCYLMYHLQEENLVLL